MTRTILHIDFDSFFASCEQQFNPILKGKPLGVTATNGRTCIIAASREAKTFGIKTGTRSWEAKKLCPQIIFIPASFVKYLEISKKFLNICKDYSPFVELFSIDEVFIDMTRTSHLFGGIDRAIKLIKTRIKKEIGECITVSVGVSHNKLLAKLASSINKPNGLFEIKFSNLNDVYQKSKLTDICGIGERIKSRLNLMGVYNLLQLRKVSLTALVSEFGNAEAFFLKNVGLGVDTAEVIPYTIPCDVKSVGRNYCLPKNEYNQRIILQNIYELCEEVGIKLRRLEKKARTVGISLRGSLDIHGRKTFQDHFDCGKEIFNHCRILLNRESPCYIQQGDSLQEEYVRQISIWVSGLQDKNKLPLSLFDKEKRNERLLSTIDLINEKFGDHTIRNGFLIYADKLTTVPNGYMADKYERIKLSKF